tara:strand:+ start:659 stop:952 length:294 start_codon:yes stop_codon:yes gene_type:complete
VIENLIYYIIIAIVFSSLMILVAYSSQTMTTCRLAKQLIVKDTLACIYVGANNTEYLNNIPKEVGVCPREYQCPYRPNTKPFSLKNVIKSIKKQFKD